MTKIAPLTPYQRDHIREDHRLATECWRRIIEHPYPHQLKSEHRHAIARDALAKGSDFCRWVLGGIANEELREDLRSRLNAIILERRVARDEMRKAV